MIVRFSPRPEDLQRLQFGPIGPHLPSFATLVAQQRGVPRVERVQSRRRLRLLAIPATSWQLGKQMFVLNRGTKKVPARCSPG